MKRWRAKYVRKCGVFAPWVEVSDLCSLLSLLLAVVGNACGQRVCPPFSYLFDVCVCERHCDPPSLNFLRYDCSVVRMCCARDAIYFCVFSVVCRGGREWSGVLSMDRDDEPLLDLNNIDDDDQLLELEKSLTEQSKANMYDTPCFPFHWSRCCLALLVWCLVVECCGTQKLVVGA